MERDLKSEIKLVEELYIPAIVEQKKTGRVSLKHPETGEVLTVDRNDAAGYLIVSTPIKGVLYRLKFSPKG